MAIFLFLDFDAGQKWRYGTLRTAHVYHQATFGENSSNGDELLRFVEKFKMAASAILNLYLATLDHTRRLLMDLKRHRKFGVDRPSSFQDIGI